MECNKCGWIDPPLTPLNEGEKVRIYKCNCEPLHNQPY